MPIFGESSEAEVTRAILAGFTKDLGEYASTEVIIVGGGPSGLVAARELALNGVKNVVIERNNYIGGGFWIGGYLMNTVTLRSPAQKYLDDPTLVRSIVADGCDKARDLARETMREVREAMGLNYS